MKANILNCCYNCDEFTCIESYNENGMVDTCANCCCNRNYDLTFDFDVLHEIHSQCPKPEVYYATDKI